MTRIYTKTGDAGETGLLGGGRVRKDDARVDAYGEVDELNACLGVARALLQDTELDGAVARLQGELFTVGAMLATPQDAKAYEAIPKLQAAWIARMETTIDRLDFELGPLTTFILPGGHPAAASLHLARTVCRRAERRVTPLALEGAVDAQIIVYLNRLSDLLFTLARAANKRAWVQDVAWNAPKG